MYGDFEPPFYHFSKGLGFEEIEKLINKGFFDEFGRGQWTDKHKYNLPPYLKLKYGFKNKTQFYPDSVYDWAELHKIKDIKFAQENRNQVLERSLVQAKVARGKPKLDLKKSEKQESIDRHNRFIGFQNYDLLDSEIHLL